MNEVCLCCAATLVCLYSNTLQCHCAPAGLRAQQHVFANSYFNV